VCFLARLCRLVKLWAAAHDINDASRSTFNSTSLLYLTTFFLQTRQLVPPLQELVDPALLNDPAKRLLCESNRCA
jgi:DNA polymerase sigma